MGLIIDASVALKWVIDEEGSDRAHGLLGQALAAPTHWSIECASALARKVRKRELLPEQAVGRLELVRRAGVRLVETELLLEPAFHLSLELQHPIYDCLYLAQAIQERSEFVTADVEFAELATKRPALADHVRLL
jgi:predicted nucleic acid-binding protein